jgi:hypothetical protein
VSCIGLAWTPNMEVAAAAATAAAANKSAE